MAVYWIAKAKTRAGDTEGAKQYIAKTLEQYLNDPSRDTVEQLINQFVQLCARKKATPRPATPDGAAGGTAVAAVGTPIPLPTPVPADPTAEIARRR